jgi:glycosyltransferase involved in cell wall biosynthesis
VRIALLVEGLSGGGVERTTLKLATGMSARGHDVDLLVAGPPGPLIDEVSVAVNMLFLKPRSTVTARLAVLRADFAGIGLLARPVLLARRLDRVVARLPSLVTYLRRVSPDVLITANFHANLCAIWARSVAGTSSRLILTERMPPSVHFSAARKLRHRTVPHLMHRYYPRADRIVTVSDALGDDLAVFAGLPRELVRTIYNPIVDQDQDSSALAEADHPWLAPGEPPVVLGVGRLAKQKDFETLIHAFAHVRRHRRARLLILGAAKSGSSSAVAAADLMGLAHALGVAEDVSLPGFRINPFAYMSRAQVFVLSSRYEGLPAVLVQAMACGCPVVSTDCLTGPREILSNGRFGPLVPVGDSRTMAEAIGRVLDHPLPSAVLRARAAQFSVAASVESYLSLIEELVPRPSSSDETGAEASSAASAFDPPPKASPLAEPTSGQSSRAANREGGTTRPACRHVPRSTARSSSLSASTESATIPPSLLSSPIVGTPCHEQDR